MAQCDSSAFTANPQPRKPKNCTSDHQPERKKSSAADFRAQCRRQIGLPENRWTASVYVTMRYAYSG